MSNIEKVKRYSENPFLQDNVTITTKKKRVTIGKNNNVLLDTDTGEITATNVVASIEVDDEQFVKLFTQNIGLMLNLTAAGNKTFVFLSWAVQKYAISKDLVTLGVYELEDFLQTNKSVEMSEATLRRGLRELVKAKIIANAKKRGNFYINPNFIFNGDRVRFITDIKRKSVNNIKIIAN